jgi:hypothetical protein
MAPGTPARGRGGTKTRTKLVGQIATSACSDVAAFPDCRCTIIRQAKEQNDDAIT